MGAEEIMRGDRALRIDVVQRGHEAYATTFWVNRAGSVLHVWQPARKVEQRLTDQIHAERWSPPAADEAIVLDRPIERRSDLDWLVVELPDDASDPDLWLAEDPWQRVYRDTTGRLLLRIERRQAYPEPMRSPLDSVTSHPYLSPSLYVHPSDSRVRAIVAQLKVPGDRDAYAMAMRIGRWVYDHMEPRSTNGRIKSS